MAEVEIRLRIDPETKKKTVTIAYRSDEDALPMEHEEEHRRIVSALLAKGLIDAKEAGDIEVERVQQAPVGETPQEQSEPGQRQSVKQGE